jgi:hypothetical protein
LKLEVWCGSSALGWTHLKILKSRRLTSPLIRRASE